MIPAKIPTAIAALLLVLALLAPAAALGAGPRVTVFGQEDQIVAIFKSAKCKKTKPRAGRASSWYAEAVSTNGGYELSADIFRSFTGFHKYDLALETNPSAYLRFSVKGEFQSGGYSNEFVPPFPVPGAGQIRFSPNGRRVGLGFGPAMWNRDASDAVVLAGAIECHYPAKRR
ncbi:MAG: hypothetical protein ACM3NV_02165 [Syntrophothermus sp.]